MSSGSDTDFDSLPEIYSGKPKKLGSFLAELQRTFKHQPGTFRSDRAKVIFATSHLRGTALKWAVDHPESQDSWTRFSEDIQTRFGNPDKKETAFNQLKKLKQHGSARAYSERWANYAADVEWAEGDKAKKNKWFYRGLKDDIKDSLCNLDWDWKMDHDQFVDKVIKIDEKLHPPHLKSQENKYGE